MKTKELIKELQMLDPSGELEVVADGAPIYFIERLPAYYDGNLQILIQDESKKPYYSIVGYKLTNKGEKLKLRTMNLEDCIYNLDRDETIDAFILDLNDVSERSKTDWTSTFEKLKNDCKQMNREIEEESKKEKGNA